MSVTYRRFAVEIAFPSVRRLQRAMANGSGSFAEIIGVHGFLPP